MKKNKKVFLMGVITLLLVSVLTVTFAFFSIGDKQSLANSFSSGCLSISIDSESRAIDLKDAIPVTDVEGLKLGSGYSFTIKNNCDKESNYAIYLDKLASTLEPDFIKVSLSSDTMDNLITKLTDNNSDFTNENAEASYNLFNGSIGASETKEFTLKEWIDYNTTTEEGASKTFKSKINVAASTKATPEENVDIKFTKSLLTLIGNLPEGSTNVKYCTTSSNVCTPNNTADITDNKITINLTENETDQLVCTSINDGKTICSNPVNGKYCSSGSSACDTIVANRTITKGEDGFSGTDTLEHKNDQDKSTLFTAEDDFGDSMYFRGNVDDNWLVFGKDTTNNEYIWWRIIRINGNGTIRLIYAGTSNSTTKAPATTGNTTMIKPSTEINDSSQYQMAIRFNTYTNDNTYVGYMIGATGQSSFDETHTNASNSKVLDEIKYWYEESTNLSTLASDYIDVETGFCGDRQVDKTAHTYYQGDGYGKQPTAYAPLGRVYNNDNWKSTQTPTLKCGYDVINNNSNKDARKRDLYTGPQAQDGVGNDALPVPVGMITIDEVIYAGGFGGKANNEYWLYTNRDSWTMSPYYLYASGDAYGFVVRYNGNIDHAVINSTENGVRPVINLSANTQLTGSGTASDPYKVEYNNAKDKILADNSVKGKPTFTGPSCSTCTLRENGVYTGEDDFGSSYIYRGSVDNNWVVFGKDTIEEGKNIWWRIIRINGNGSIRLMYAGTSNSDTNAPSATGDITIITPKTPATSSNPNAVKFNSKYDDNKYVGYMYPGATGTASADFDGAHAAKSGDTKSDVLTQIELWYNQDTNLGDLLKDYIDVDTGFCSDSTVSEINHGSEYQGTSQGYSKQKTVYAGGDRIWQSGGTSAANPQTPTLKCGYKSDGSTDTTAQKRDLYTGPNATRGNNALPVPVGLITMDEVIYAGGFYGTSNANYWLKTDKFYWTMTPSNFDGTYARVFNVYSDGSFNYSDVNNSTNGVRPVINLKSNVKLTGSGTTTDPYIVS